MARMRTASLRRATTSANTGLLYLQLASSSSITFPESLGISVQLPSSVTTTGQSFYLAMLSGGAWNTIAGPASVNGQTLTFTPTNSPLAIAANQPLELAVYAGNVLGTLPPAQNISVTFAAPQLPTAVAYRVGGGAWQIPSVASSLTISVPGGIGEYTVAVACMQQYVGNFDNDAYVSIVDATTADTTSLAFACPWDSVLLNGVTITGSYDVSALPTATHAQVLVSNEENSSALGSTCTCSAPTGTYQLVVNAGLADLAVAALDANNNIVGVGFVRGFQATNGGTVNAPTLTPADATSQASISSGAAASLVTVNGLVFPMNDTGGMYAVPAAQDTATTDYFDFIVGSINTGGASAEATELVSGAAPVSMALPTPLTVPSPIPSPFTFNLATASQPALYALQTRTQQGYILGGEPEYYWTTTVVTPNVLVGSTSYVFPDLNPVPSPSFIGLSGTVNWSETNENLEGSNPLASLIIVGESAGGQSFAYGPPLLPLLAVGQARQLPSASGQVCVGPCTSGDTRKRKP
jgi:hypothetical protein